MTAPEAAAAPRWLGGCIVEVERTLLGYSGAVFSPDRTYRYSLTRHWGTAGAKAGDPLERRRSDVVRAAIEAADRDAVAVLPEPQLEVLRPVVHRVAVDVVDGFGWQQRASYVPCHDNPVLKDIAIGLAHAGARVIGRDLNSDVAAGRYLTLTQVPSLTLTGAPVRRGHIQAEKQRGHESGATPEAPRDFASGDAVMHIPANCLVYAFPGPFRPGVARPADLDAPPSQLLPEAPFVDTETPGNRRERFARAVGGGGGIPIECSGLIPVVILCAEGHPLAFEHVRCSAFRATVFGCKFAQLHACRVVGGKGFRVSCPFRSPQDAHPMQVEQRCDRIPGLPGMLCDRPNVRPGRIGRKRLGLPLCRAQHVDKGSPSHGQSVHASPPDGVGIL